MVCMERIDEIERFVKTERLKGLKGYKEIKKYFWKYNVEQLDYIEMQVKAKLMSLEHFFQYLNLFPMVLSAGALILSILPENSLKNPETALDILSVIFGIIVFVLIGYKVVHQYCSTKIINATYILSIVNEVRQYKKQAGKEYNVKVNMEESGEANSYHIKLFSD